MKRIAGISKLEPSIERFVEMLDASIRSNSDETLDTLFDRAALDQSARQAAIASVHERFGHAVLMDDADIARVGVRKAVLSLLDTFVGKADAADRRR